MNLLEDIKKIIKNDDEHMVKIEVEDEEEMNMLEKVLDKYYEETEEE